MFGEAESSVESRGGLELIVPHSTENYGSEETRNWKSCIPRIWGE
jgi:hypothetical protein